MEKRSINDTPEDPEVPKRPGWEGMHVWWLVSKGETGSSKVVLDIAEFPPGKAHEVHRHPNCEEITYVLGGSGLHTSDGEPVRQNEGRPATSPRANGTGSTTTPTSPPPSSASTAASAPSKRRATRCTRGKAPVRPEADVVKLALANVAPDDSLDPEGGWVGMMVRWLFDVTAWARGG